ncbi:hypothetical protein Q8A73_019421 [Channa argus]|nr:hypothetical protein Q8A73_019421 [Channa argus]
MRRGESEQKTRTPGLSARQAESVTSRAASETVRMSEQHLSDCKEPLLLPASDLSSFSPPQTLLSSLSHTHTQARTVTRSLPLSLSLSLSVRPHPPTPSPHTT